MLNQGGDSAEFSRKDAVTLVCVVVGIVALLAVFLTDWRALTIKDWVGDTGLIASGAAVLGVLGAVAAGFGVYLNNLRSIETLEHARRTETGARFQRAVEMLAGDNATAAAGAVIILSEIAREWPETYFLAVVRLLSIYIAETDADFKRSVWASVSRYQTWPPSREGTWQAINTLANMLAADRERRLTAVLYYKGKFPIGPMFVSNRGFLDRDLSHLLCTELVLNEVAFQRCKLEASTLRMKVGRNVILADCSFRNAVINLVRDDGRPVRPADQENFQIFRPTDIDGARINNVPFAEWYIEHMSARVTAATT